MFLKRNPFVRLLLPFVCGVMVQWYLQLPAVAGIVAFLIAAAGHMYFLRLKDFEQLRYGWLGSMSLHICIIAMAILLTYCKDIRHGPGWVGGDLEEEQMLAAVLQEPLIEKERAYKAELALRYKICKGEKQNVKGYIIAYFKKDSATRQLQAGEQILFSKPIQEIRNSGNPAAFDYKRYALFNKITHQVYLTGNDYKKLPGICIPAWKKALFTTRDFVLNAVKSNIKGDKEQGLAEAMLIGYKEDLDKSLLQSYTNTGVVHVIAVSGMHLALLYWLLNLLLQPLLKRKATKWLHPVLVLFILWAFSFVAGGAASIVRAAVMFTFITIGKQINRNASICNILAASAFCQLCHNPYWLWDVGFQLSYIAVLSIVIFYKPVYDLLFVKNKILNRVWQLAAVSIAAQVLTTPLSLYYFHQFPVYFLLGNLVVVPVSTVVLIGTLILVVVSPFQIVATPVGFLLKGVIWWLNTFIERMEAFPFAVWKGIQINTLQMILLFVIIAGISFWLIEKYKTGMWAALSGLLLFFVIRAVSFYQADQQQRMIVYNISRHTVADFISGRNYATVAGAETAGNISIENYTLKPSRTMQRITAADNLRGFYRSGNAVLFNNKKILFINGWLFNTGAAAPVEADIVVLTGNPGLYISDLIKRITPKQLVIDGSVPSWKARYWIKDSDSLKIPCHNVASDGAFVMNLY